MIGSFQTIQDVSVSSIIFNATIIFCKEMSMIAHMIYPLQCQDVNGGFAFMIKLFLQGSAPLRF